MKKVHLDPWDPVWMTPLDWLWSTIFQSSLSQVCCNKFRDRKVKSSHFVFAPSERSWAICQYHRVKFTLGFACCFFATKIGLHHHQLQIIDTLFVVRASFIFLLCCFRGGFGPFVHMLLVANVEAKTFCHRIDGWWEERIWCEIQNLCLLVQLMWWPAKRRRTKKNIRIHTSEVSESSSGGLAPGVTWYSIQWTNLISQFRFCTNYLIRLFGMDAKRTYYFPIYSQVKWKDTLSWWHLFSTSKESGSPHSRL